MTENLSNDFQTTLSSAIADGTTTAISVASSSGAPSPNFRIRVDDEIMVVTSIGTGLNWTVTRGAEGTAAVAHASAATATHVVTAAGLLQYLTDRFQSGAAPGLFANGGFDVAQLGNSGTLTTSIAYPIAGGPDRWAFRQSSVAAGSYSRVASTFQGFLWMLKLGRNNGATSTGEIAAAQVCETQDCVRYAGKQVTLSLGLKAGSTFSAASSRVTVEILTGTGTDQGVTAFDSGTQTGAVTPLSTSQTLTTTETVYSFTFNVPSTATQIAFRTRWTPVGTAGVDDNVYTTGIRLDPGALPGQGWLNIGQELALAQRWRPAWLSDSTAFFVGNGNVSASTVCALNVSYATQTRVTPTSIVVSGGGIVNVVTAAGNLTSSAIALGGKKSSVGANINLTVSGATAGQGATCALNAVGAYIYLGGAELL